MPYKATDCTKLLHFYADVSVLQAIRENTGMQAALDILQFCGLHIFFRYFSRFIFHENDPVIWSVQRQCVDLLASAQNAADTIILQMQNIAEMIPEYKVLRSMHGVGDRLGPIILAEIGDIRRFHTAKRSTRMPATMPFHINPVNSRARTATSQNMAVLPSGRLVLRLCRPLN